MVVATNLCFERNIPQIHLIHLVDNYRIVPINDAERFETNTQPTLF